MAGPSIVVRVLGDLKAFGQSLNQVGAQTEGVAKRGAAAFHSFLGGINATGVLGPMGPMLDQVDAAIQRVTEHGAKVGPTMLAAGGGLTALGAGLSAFGSKEQQSQQQLAQAITNTGKNFADYKDRIEAAGKQGEAYGKTTAQTNDALRILTQATHDPAKALDDLSVAFDLSAAKHEDLSTAATAIGRVFNGNNRVLKEFGITSGKDAPANLAALANVLKGQASASADTFGGKVSALKAKIEDQVAVFGQKYGPAIQAAGVALMALGTISTVVGPLMGTMMTIALGPIGLIVLAVLALIAIGILLWKNWDTIWKAIQSVISTVWDWIKNNWPLLLAILLGPFGVAVDLIVKNWDTIRQGAEDVINWIGDHWQLLLAILLGPISLAAAIIIGFWDQIRGAASDAVDWIVGRWNDLVSTIEGLPGRIASAAGGMFDGIWQAFRSAVNSIIDGWNSLKFTVGGGSFLGVDIPSFTLSTPQIPRLATGGIVTRPTLALIGEAGPEAVVPLGRGVGPAVHIENVNVSTELDVELFMRRAAWVAQTSRI